MDVAIRTSGLAKRFGDVRVLEGVDLAVPRGTVLGLLGPNGAGKTTAVRVLATLLAPDAGRAEVAGFDVVRQAAEVRRRISLTGQYAAVDELLTGEENLLMLGRLCRLPRAANRARCRELLELFDLVEARGRPAKTYSGGMRRRLDLAAGLVGRPEVLFLDEPTTGLDPRSRQTTWDVVRALVREGGTVLLTTQHLEEADALADRIAVLDGGRVVAEGTGAELKQRVAGRRLDLVLPDADTYARAARLLGGRVVHRRPEARTVGVGTDGSAAELRRLLDGVQGHGLEVDRVVQHTATLDEVFLALTGRPPAADPDPGDGDAARVPATSGSAR